MSLRRSAKQVMCGLKLLLGCALSRTEVLGQLLHGLEHLGGERAGGCPRWRRRLGVGDGIGDAVEVGWAMTAVAVGGACGATGAGSGERVAVAVGEGDRVGACVRAGVFDAAMGPIVGAGMEVGMGVAGGPGVATSSNVTEGSGGGTGAASGCPQARTDIRRSRTSESLH